MIAEGGNRGHVLVLLLGLLQWLRLLLRGILRLRSLALADDLGVLDLLPRSNGVVVLQRVHLLLLNTLLVRWLLVHLGVATVLVAGRLVRGSILGVVLVALQLDCH